MGSPFASRRVATLPIPFDLPNEVTLQALAGRHIEKAEIAAQAKWIESMDAKGGVKKQREVMRAFKDEDDKPSDKTPEPEPQKDEPVDPLAGLDQYTVCRFGIKSWTYEESLKPEPVEDDDSPFASLQTELLRRLDDSIAAAKAGGVLSSLSGSIRALFDAKPPTMRVRVKAIDDMGPDELKWFATEVMRLTKPRLFQTKDEREESEKNDSAASLTH